MSLSKFIRLKWKLLLNVVTILALLILIYLTRDQIINTIENLSKVNAWALLLLIPIEALNYHAQTKMYQGLFKIVGNKLSYRSLLKASIELNFVNQVFPSAGVTGISYFGMRIKEKDIISGGKATLIQIMKLVIIILSFEVLLIVGLLSLAIFGKVSDLTILVSGVLATVLFCLMALFVFIVGKQDRIDSFFTFITKLINKFIAKFFHQKAESINISKARVLFNDFHSNYRQIMTHIRDLKSPFNYALLANITELLAIYVVYVAFGKFVNIGAIIIAYGVANFAGLISFLPGGIGIYEALMTVVLATTGIPPRISLPVTIMYRVINTAIQVPPGYYLYHKAINTSHSSIKSDK